MDDLIEHRADAFDINLKVPCKSHGKMCPMMGSEDSEDSDTDGHGSDRLSDSDRRTTPLSMTLAGVTCNAWSRENQSKSRFSHPSEEAHNCFIVKRIVLAELEEEDMVFIECVDGYEVLQKVVQPLQTHTPRLVLPGQSI